MLRNRRKTIPPAMLLAGTLVVLLILVVGLWRGVASRLLYALFEPVLAFRNAITSTEASALRAELASLEAKVADRDLLYLENLDLKRRLGRDARVSITLASVLLRPPGVPYDTFIIDAGAREGIVKGDLVSAGGTTLIGTVEEVYDSTSRVTLFSSPGNTYQGMISGAIPILVEGQGGGSMRGEVPAGSVVAVGDPVLIPGIAGGFASVVSAVQRGDAESFETIYLHLPVSPFSLRMVEVWKVSKPPALE